MPNWVQNIITVKPSNIEKLKEVLLNEGEEVDFNKIIPMPEDIFLGNLGDKEKEKYGEKNWYDWSIANWDTKWNANETIVNDNSIDFQTAWSHPEKVIIQLSKLLPKVILQVQYADEDIGSNCGEYRILNGEILSQKVFASEDNARKFANDLWGFEEEEESE